MTYPGSSTPSAAPQWRVWSLRRAGKKFRWSLLPNRPVNTNNPFAVLLGLLVLLEVVFVMPTVGLVRLAVHNIRSPGWYLEARYVTSDGRPNDSRVELQVETKRQAKRLQRMLQHEFGSGADFTSPAVQAAIAHCHATRRPTAPPPISGGTY
ncbi:MAG TPA: hypothetical protein VJ914_36780 [Pseudonocardiaceae bacterium]|nr:hypothetical protein [Pseudonocardiaceae bacterium]